MTLHGFYLGEKTWRDGNKKSLEDQLNDIVAGIIETFERIRQRKIEEKIQAQRKLEEQQRREEELRRIREEGSRREQLEQQAENWRKSKDIYDYLKACEEYFITQGREVDSESAEAKWLAWAKAHADRLNPLKNSRTEEMIKREEF